MCQKKVMRKRSSEHLSDEPPKKRISPSGNNLPTQISPGEIFTDLTGKQWRLGKAIGSGGFGDIYLISDKIKEAVKNDAKYVAKIENHSNGPLFVEINCLLRIAKLQMIEDWKRTHKNMQLGVPHYIASGSHTLKNEKLRFLIIPRYEQDLEKIFLLKNKKFNLKTVILICIQILDALEYIHSKGYVHCDIKASNMLFCTTKTSNKLIKKEDRKRKINLRKIERINYHEESMILHDCCCYEPKKNLRNTQRINYDEDQDTYFQDLYYKQDMPEPIKVINEKESNQIILIDYGLATKYLQSDGRHKQFCNDERKAHAGTIQFCSIDAHLGASSRRSDLESLGYNIIYWLTSTLPWDDTNNPENVQRKKEYYLNNLKTFLTECFNKETPNFIYEYFKYVTSLTFESKPDYSLCKKLFQSALKEYGYKDDGLFDFDNKEGWGRKPKKSKQNLENKGTRKSIKSGRIPLTSNIIIEKPKLRTKTGGKKSTKKRLNWSFIPDPEEILRKNKNQEVSKVRERKLTETSDSSYNGNSVQYLDIKSLNPTYAMLEVYYKCKDKNANYNNVNKTDKGYKISCELEHREGYTPAMNLVLTKMNQRRFEEQQQEIENMVPVKKNLRSTNIQSSTKLPINMKIQPSTKTNSTKKSLKSKLLVTVRKGRSKRGLRGFGLRG